MYFLFKKDIASNLDKQETSSSILYYVQLFPNPNTCCKSTTIGFIGALVIVGDIQSLKQIRIYSRVQFIYALQVELQSFFFAPVNVAGQTTACPANPFTGAVFKQLLLKRLSCHLVSKSELHSTIIPKQVYMGVFHARVCIIEFLLQQKCNNCNICNNCH